MALRKLERRNYGGKWPVSIKYQNLHSFKEGSILLWQSTLETKRITHLNGSAYFTTPLISLILNFFLSNFQRIKAKKRLTEACIMHFTLRKIFFKKRTNYEFELFFRQTAQKKKKKFAWNNAKHGNWAEVSP